jgi:hypothetical protein
MNLLEKKAVSFEELEAQNAFELPNREMLLVTVVVTNLLNNNTVSVDVSNNQVAVQVCAVVQAITAFTVAGVDCDIVKNK